MDTYVGVGGGHALIIRTTSITLPSDYRLRVKYQFYYIRMGKASAVKVETPEWSNESPRGEILPSFGRQDVRWRLRMRGLSTPDCPPD